MSTRKKWQIGWRGWTVDVEGILWSTSDGPQTWTRVRLPGVASNGLPHFETASHGVMPMQLSDEGRSGFVFGRTNDAGATWTIDPGRILPTSSAIWDMALAGPSGWSVLLSDGSLVDTQDAGRSWTTVASDLPGSVMDISCGTRPTAGQPRISLSHAALYATADGGESWRLLAPSALGRAAP